ncbi:hypothetical protein [Paenibacillus alvei]|uniref:hypothetical protein n=1 Tax=Paenibacillus alvei TaxID=44250 RepID=UPI00227EFE91|nr:hypothetical protein [Paenibacillus alvei]
MTIVGLLGTIHNEEIRHRVNCTLNLYKDIIIEFNPEIICGEVHPQSWMKYQNDKSLRGYWGEPASEYWDLIFPLCEQHNIEFVPIDWFELDVWNNFDPFAVCNKIEREKYERIEEEWFEKQLKTHSVGTIPFNSDEYDLVTREKYEWISNINPRAHNFRWTIRNRIMIERLKNTIKANPHKKILCIVGADHNYYFKEELENEPINLVYPLITR